MARQPTATTTVDAPRRDACAWCGGPIPAASAAGRARRRDSLTCRKECRQARHRFAGAVPPAAAASGRPLRFAYADPPYPGLARRYYRCPEVDHHELVGRLVADFPDGWALSTSSAAVREVLLLCPPDVRVAVWFRGMRPGAARRARDAWEPLIVCGGRLYDDAPADLCNVFTGSPSARARSHPGALVGMKSAAFAAWMFAQLGAARGDQLVDLFPGSGAVSRAWRLYTGAPELGPGIGSEYFSADSPVRAADVPGQVVATAGASSALERRNMACTSGEPPPPAAATRLEYSGDGSPAAPPAPATRLKASDDTSGGRPRPVAPSSSTRRRGPTRQLTRPQSREEGLPR